MRKPPAHRVHLALILTQCLFGVGSVVGRLGVASFNPMVFALIREASASVLLFAFALRVDGVCRIRRRDAAVFLGCGFCIFANQACFIVGAKLAGAVLASSWQPVQPVMTLVISAWLGWERLTLYKISGILVSLGGAAFMSLPGTSFDGAGVEILAGNALFFCNCLGTALYVIASKVAFGRGYPPSTVTACSYACGAVMMAATAAAFSSSCELVSLLCPPPQAGSEEGAFECDGRRTSCAPWAVPAAAVGPLVYWILCSSCVCYWLLTWGSQHAPAGYVLAYCALQPVVAAGLTVAIIGSGLRTDLELPRFPNVLGVLGVIGGLFLVVYDARSSSASSSPLAAHAQRSQPFAGALDAEAVLPRDPLLHDNSIQRLSDPLVVAGSAAAAAPAARASDGGG